MNIKFNDLKSQWDSIKDDTLPKLLNCLENGNYILGEPVTIFEENFAKWNGNKYSIGVANGTDALKISIESLSLVGSSVFYIPSNTYIATALSPYLSFNKNFIIKLIDCDIYGQIDTILLEDEIKKDINSFQNLVVIPVHLFGSTCDIESIIEISNKYNLIVIEDCSQSHGATSKSGKKVGTFGRISAFSCYPGKNLGAAGDAGVIVTDDYDLYIKCKYLRNIGSIEKYVHKYKGWNSRLDTIQSIILDEKLKLLDEWNNNRINVAEYYINNIKNNKITILDKPPYCSKHVYHIFTILVNDRDKLQSYLNTHNIPNLIHYPIPIEKSESFYPNDFNSNKTLDFSKKIMSLPIHPFMTLNEMSFIVDKLNNF
jgi:dTDP-4-amino-4,6-dideoxygalactose transaminase